MNREEYLNTHLPAELKYPAIGQIVNELDIDEFETVYKRIFDGIMKIHEADVSDTAGYGRRTPGHHSISNRSSIYCGCLDISANFFFSIMTIDCILFI